MVEMCWINGCTKVKPSLFQVQPASPSGRCTPQILKLLGLLWDISGAEL